MAIRVSRQNVEALIVETPEVYVSRQNVEALIVETPEVYVSRQNVEVLYRVPQIYEVSATSTLVLTPLAEREPIVFNRSATAVLYVTQDTTHSPQSIFASNTLDLSQETRFPGTHYASTTSILTLDDVAVNTGLITVSATSVLTLVQYADDVIHVRDANSILTITDIASVDKILRGFSVLELTDQARTSNELLASSNLILTQTARQNLQKRYGTSQIEFAQITKTSPRFLPTSNTLVLSDDNIVTKSIRVSATSELTTSEEQWIGGELVTVQTGLRDEAAILATTAHSALSRIPLQCFASAHVAFATGISASATSTINFSQLAALAIEESATSTLVLTQTAVGDAAKPGRSTLTFTQAGTFTIDRGIAATSTFELEQSVTFTLIIGTTLCQYSPFVGDTTDTDLPTPPPAAIDGPMVGIEVPFQLVYPSIGAVTDSVALKTPNLGNKDRLSFQRVLRETRGGTLIVYADPIWPKTQTLVLTFSGLLRVEAHELLTFIDDHLGIEIGLIDWEHRYWRGVVVTPDEPAIEDRFDSFTVNFEFQGELDPTWNPQVVPEGLRYSAIRSAQEDGYYVPSEPALPGMPETYIYYTAITDNLTKVGNPLYLTGAGHVDLARANAAGTTQVVGLAQSDYTVGQACNYLTEGRIERLDWTIIVGTPDLSIGATYFLDPNTAGYLTTTAPTTTGQYVVRVGRAVDARTLDIEIELPILL